MVRDPKVHFKLKVVTPELQVIDDGVPQWRYAAMRAQVKGAFKSAIQAHGPIDKNLIGSVLKRLEHQPAYKELLRDRPLRTAKAGT